MSDDDARLEQRHRSEVAQARRLTDWFRSGSDPEWVAVRARLQAEGIAPEDAAIGTMFPDDVKLVYGVILSRDGRSFDFDIEEQPDGTSRLFRWAPFPRERAPEWFGYAQAVLDSDPPNPAGAS